MSFVDFRCRLYIAHNLALLQWGYHEKNSQKLKDLNKLLMEVVKLLKERS